MFNNNLQIQSECKGNEMGRVCSSKIIKEIYALEDRKTEIRHQIQSCESRSRLMDRIKEQIEVNRHIITTIEGSIERLRQRLKRATEDKTQLVISLQHMQYCLQSMGKQLVKFFQPKPKQLDEIRLKIIEVETDPELIRLQAVFSIRRYVFCFLKQRGCCEFKYAPQLEISGRGLVQQFKRFLFNRLEEQNTNQYKQILLEPILVYLSLLKKAQSIVLSNPDQSQIQSCSQSQFQQIQQSILSAKRQIVKINKRIKEQSSNIIQIEIKISTLQQILAKRQNDKKEASLTVQKLKGRLAQVSHQSIQTKSLLGELNDVNQAIAYLSSSRFRNENIDDVNIRSYKQIEWQNQISTNPSQITSLDMLVSRKTDQTKSSNNLKSFKSPIKQNKSYAGLRSSTKINSPSWK